MNKNIKSYNTELFLQTLNTHFSESTASVFIKRKNICILVKDQDTMGTT